MCTQFLYLVNNNSEAERLLGLYSATSKEYKTSSRQSAMTVRQTFCEDVVNKNSIKTTLLQVRVWPGQCLSALVLESDSAAVSLSCEPADFISCHSFRVQSVHQFL